MNERRSLRLSRSGGARAGDGPKDNRRRVAPLDGGARISQMLILSTKIITLVGLGGLR